MLMHSFMLIHCIVCLPYVDVRADGQDVVYIRVAILDGTGAVVPNAAHRIDFAVAGPGGVYGVANGDPNDHTPDKASYRNAFKGLARVIVEYGGCALLCSRLCAAVRNSIIVFGTECHCFRAVFLPGWRKLHTNMSEGVSLLG